ncbi:glycosyltransferase family 2 protein [Caldovatus aquaticus]|uniref:Glycosyltransferase n=1 Tax=Caldovatus aquaticus TaxID=2865671 RepID=A0ABS7EYN0_9PROT|nr:glycosyltransferase [Caldovatus aquaticus]MBW8268394.1 glycosyltransferase [Caldovatus aquaticus]
MQDHAAAAAALRRVTAVTVTHDSAAVIGGFLAACPEGLRVIVVDNASGDGTAQAVAASGRAGLRLLRAPANRGFGAGCNLGLGAVETEFAFLVNPDVRISAPAVAALVAAADRFPDAAILAPTLREAPDPRHPEGRAVHSWNAAQHRRRLLSRDRDAEPWPEGPICTWYVSGAAMLVRRDDAASWLRFDEGYFLYYEDDDLCAQAIARGRSVVLVPEAAVAHAGGRSSAPSARIVWRKAYHMARSRLRFARKHHGPEAARAEALRQLGRHAAKALGHAATARGSKLLADLAAGAATLAWLAEAGRGGAVRADGRTG